MAGVGRFAGAEFVVTGSVVALPRGIRIDTRVVRIGTVGGSAVPLEKLAAQT